MLSLWFLPKESRRIFNMRLTDVLIWLSEQASAVARDRIGPGRVEAVHAIYTAKHAFQ